MPKGYPDHKFTLEDVKTTLETDYPKIKFNLPDNQQLELSALPVEQLVEKIIELCKTRTTILVDSGITQCKPGKRRSSGDVYKLVEYYHGKADFVQIRRILETMVIDKKINCSICPDIKRRVYWPYPYEHTNQFGNLWHEEHMDEFGWHYKTHQDAT